MGFERSAFLALLRSPSLLVEAWRAWWGMRRRNSVRSARSYLGWRTVTAYGDEKTTVSAHDMVEYLSWRREMRRMRSWGPRS